jgi:hypothetical protein
MFRVLFQEDGRKQVSENGLSSNTTVLPASEASAASMCGHTTRPMLSWYIWVQNITEPIDIPGKFEQGVQADSHDDQTSGLSPL